MPFVQQKTGLYFYFLALKIRQRDRVTNTIKVLDPFAKRSFQNLSMAEQKLLELRGSLHVSLFYWTADVLAFLLLGVGGIISSKKREKKGAFLCQ